MAQVPPDVGQTPTIQPMFVITVGDPQKVGDPVRAFITYTVHTRVGRILTHHESSSFLLLTLFS